LACHALWPFDAQSKNGVSVLVGAHEVGEDYRVYRVDAARLLVAFADIAYVSPTDSDFIGILARNSLEIPRSDVFLNNHL
jgi:hypothetical protein